LSVGTLNADWSLSVKFGWLAGPNTTHSINQTHQPETHSALVWLLLLLLPPQALTEFFGTLSADWALECLKELLLTNMQVGAG
jgi:hypothetical protein